jgi:hypothetical protein
MVGHIRRTLKSKRPAILHKVAATAVVDMVRVMGGQSAVDIVKELLDDVALIRIRQNV